jgi:hypothetical protein
MSDDVVDNQVEHNASEQEAKQFGWVPLEEFKGNPDDWRDADTFLRRGREINGFLRKDMEKLNSKLAQKDAELAEVRATIEEFKKYHNDTEERAYKRALDDLKQQKKEAIAQGDGERVVEIDDEIDLIKEAKATKPTKAEKAPDTATYDAEYFAWAKDNLWFTTNSELKSIAMLIGEELNATAPNLRGKEFLDEVTKRTREAAPDLFENPARSNASVSSSSDSRAPSTKKKKGYNDLPAEAKQACDRFVKSGLMTQEKYVSEYQWD